jgi:hypothetical protein
MNQSERNIKINTELFGKIRMEGELEKWPVNKPLKPGKEKLWKGRYFVLADNLCYFDSEEEFKKGKKPKGVICLDFAAIALHSLDKSKLSLRTPGKMLILKAKSEGETETWLRGLKLAQQGENH